MQARFWGIAGWFAVGLLAGARGAIAAQVPDSGPASLPTVRVVEEEDRLPTTGATARDSTTATRFDADPRAIPQSIGILGEELIEELAPREPADLAYLVSGVSRRTNLGDGVGFTVRGFEIAAQATVDGMRNPRVSGATSTFGVPDMALYERIEILKGHSAVLYGRGNPGGTVNFVTRKPQSQGAHAIEAGISADNYYRIVGDSTGPITDALSYRVIAVGQNADYFTRGIEDDRRVVAPSVLWKTPLGGELLVNYERNEAEFVAPYNAVRIQQGGVDRIVAYDRYDPRNRPEEMDQDNARLSYSQPFAGEWRFVGDFSYSNLDFDQGQMLFRPNSAVNPTGSIGNNFRQQRTDKGHAWRTEVQGAVQTGAISHQLLLGFERYSRDSLIRRTDSADFGPGPLFQPQFGAPLPAPLNPVQLFAGSGQVDERGAYTLLHSTWNRVHTLAGVRHTDFDAFNPLTQLLIDKESATTPSVGVVYDFTPSLSAYASWGRSFQPNGGTDINGAFFEPRRGTQQEIGVKGDALDGRVNYTVAAFKLLQDNITTTDPNNPAFSALLGEVDIQGVELDVAASLTARLTLINTLTFLDSEITRNNNGFQGRPLSNTPEFSGTIRLSFAANDALRVAGTLVHVGERSGSDFAVFDVDGYERLDIDASWRVSPRLTLMANIENVTDEDYVLAAYGNNQITLGRPLTPMLRARYDF